MALWSDEEEVVCIHPGGPRLVGWLQVRQSYEQLLAMSRPGDASGA